MYDGENNVADDKAYLHFDFLQRHTFLNKTLKYLLFKIVFNMN